MNAEPTIVVKFGEGVAAGEFFVVELDEALNRNASKQGTILFTYTFGGVEYFLMHTSRGVLRVPAGEVRSRFAPGDPAYFLLHYDPARVYVAAVAATAGTVVVGSMVDRRATDQVLFDAPDEPRELTHIPSGEVSASWYGRAATLDRQGRQITASATPAIADIAYPYQALSAVYHPPPMELSGDDVYPIAIVVSVEAVTP
jgi:hypothetical protein